MKKRSLVLLLIGLVVAVLAGCGGGETQVTEKDFVGEWKEVDFAYASKPNEKTDSEGVTPNNTNHFVLKEDGTAKVHYYKIDYDTTWSLKEGVVSVAMEDYSFSITKGDGDTLVVLSYKDGDEEPIWTFTYKK